MMPGRVQRLAPFAVVLLLAASAHGFAPSILVADGLAPSALMLLRSAGANVVERHYAQTELGAALGEYDAVIIRSATTLTSEIIEAGAGGRLRVIGRAGVGVDNVDIEAARAAGCWVLNTPGASTASVVELTLAHMLAAARGLQEADIGLKSGRWLKGSVQLGQRGGPRLGHELSGKRLGLLGFGRIAQGVAKAASALGMHVVAYSRTADESLAASLDVELAASAADLFSTCSHVVILCALNDETRGFVDRNKIELMPQRGADGTPCGSHLFNMARGGIVVEMDAANCLQDNSLTTYCADVYEKEPPSPTNPLLRCDNFHGTPHVGGATMEAQARVGMLIAGSVLKALEVPSPLLGVEEGTEGVVAAGRVINDPSVYMW